MKTDFTTAPLASGLRGADGDTVEKSYRLVHKKMARPIFVIPFVDDQRLRQCLNSGGLFIAPEFLHFTSVFFPNLCGAI